MGIRLASTAMKPSDWGSCAMGLIGGKIVHGENPTSPFGLPDQQSGSFAEIEFILASISDPLQSSPPVPFEPIDRPSARGYLDEGHSIDRADDLPLRVLLPPDW